MSDKKSPIGLPRSRSSLASRNYPRYGRRRIAPGIPRAANWGWGHLPLPAKIMIVGVLCGIISLTTPYWAYIKAEATGLSTFGLWHYCSGDVCTSIHDNLIEGRSVGMWYHLTQGNMCIGVACSIVGLAMLTNSIEGKNLKMTSTVHFSVCSVLAISAFEQFVALSVFANYLDHTDFLYYRDGSNRIDFYGSYYSGIVSLAASLLAAFVVFLDDKITVKEKKLEEQSDMKISQEEMIKYLSARYRQDSLFYGYPGYPNYGTYQRDGWDYQAGYNGYKDTNGGRVLGNNVYGDSYGDEAGGFVNAEDFCDENSELLNGWYQSPNMVNK